MKFLLLAFLSLGLSQVRDIVLRTKEKGIPSVGKGLEVEALVVAEKKDITPVKLFIVRDKIPFELTAKLESEDPKGLIYSALAPAPVKEMIVIAYVPISAEKAIKSKPLFIKRPCVQKTELEKEVSLDRIPVENLIELNEGLTFDTELYQNLIKQIETLARVLDQ
ncbi:MAG: hypothetical protein NZT61_00860 [Deltaproteobacteria bacterium]|nr:hypothetical protein [Deltaproteobacteria bacterium]MCX7953311.1 hypothetical protein [Deltaproteobacteria bacterium]